jgi:hypothetical protein
MMKWTDTFDAVFFISIATLIIGLAKHTMDKCHASKCENFSLCWNLIQVKRRVDLEVQEEIRSMELERERKQPAEVAV